MTQITSVNGGTGTPFEVPDYLIRHTTLRQLQVFEAIVRLGSFTRAAEELFLTQPTVSMQIKKLAEVIGLPLFERVGRNVSTTEAGLELYDTCRRVFEVLSHLEMKMADLQGLKRGRLRIAVITTAKYITPEMLGEFKRLYPGVDLSLKVTNRERVFERMQNNEDDLYITAQLPDDGSEVESYPFTPNPLVVMAPCNHPLVGKKNIKLRDIAREPFIMREPGSGVRDSTLEAFEAKKLHPNVIMELGSNEAIKHAIVGGLGISVLSLHTLTFEGANGPVAILDVEGFPIIRQWKIIYPQGKELSLVARTFLDFALMHEPEILERILKQWPSLREVLKNGKKAKKRHRKKQHSGL